MEKGGWKKKEERRKKRKSQRICRNGGADFKQLTDAESSRILMHYDKKDSPGKSTIPLIDLEDQGLTSEEDHWIRY